MSTSSYIYVNQSVLYYYAEPSTPGYVDSDHVITWTFDDGSPSQIGQSVTKVWTTPGSHTATATAVCTPTGTSGTDTRTINVLSYNAILARGGHTSSLLSNNKVLLAGGSYAGFFLCSAVLYNPTNPSKYDFINPPMSYRRSYTTPANKAISLQNNNILLTGDCRPDNFFPYETGYYTSQVQEIYNPTTNSFSTVASNIEDRLEHSVSHISSDSFGFPETVVSIGGKSDIFDVETGAETTAYLSDIEVYDVATNASYLCGISFPTTIQDHVAIPGYTSPYAVLVIGGIIAYSYTDSNGQPGNAWPYQTYSVQLTAGGGSGGSLATVSEIDTSFSLLYPRIDHTCVDCTTINGALYIFGGSTIGQTPDPTNVDPYGNQLPGTLDSNGNPVDDGSWIHTFANTEMLSGPFASSVDIGPMITPRALHTSTLLNNGKILIVGGSSSSGISSDCELFDPSTNTFTATGSLNIGRAYHTATLLADGKVLIAFGYCQTDTPPYGTTLDNVEIYDPTTGTFTLYELTPN